MSKHIPAMLLTKRRFAFTISLSSSTIETIMINGVIFQKLQTLDEMTILVDVVNNHLMDFDQFRAEVLAYVQR